MALIMYSQFLVLYLACMHSLCHLVIQSKRKTHSLRITAPGVEDAKEESNTVAVLRTHTTYNRLVLLCLRKPWVTKPFNWRMTHVCRIDTPDSSDVLVSFALPWYSGGHILGCSVCATQTDQSWAKAHFKITLNAERELILSSMQHPAHAGSTRLSQNTEDISNLRRDRISFVSSKTCLQQMAYRFLDTV